MKFALRESSYRRYGGETRCSVYFLVDESGALSFEAQLVGAIRNLRHLPRDATGDVDAILRAAVR
jgi:hypothetical protein